MTNFAKKIQEHNSYQSTTLKGVDFNIKICANLGVEYSQSYPLNSSYNAINGQIMDSFWEQVDKKKLKIDLNAALTGKIFGLKAANYFRVLLLEKTKKLITEIDKKIIEN